VLPISIDYNRETDDPPGDVNGTGWLVRVLPFADQQALHDQMVSCYEGNWANRGGMNDRYCRPFYTTQLSLHECPSDPSARELTTDMYRYVGTPVAQTSYKGVMGDNPLGGPSSIHVPRSAGCNHTPDCNGLLFPESYIKPVSLDDVVDGTSKTLLVGEDVPEHNVHSFWIHSDCDFSSTYAPLNFMPKPPEPLNYWNVMGFRSRHPGGANFAMADGSVTFVDETIDFTLYRDLSTRAGHETVSLP
jgi:prepilin-type processing-associated H-X9-DG protein